MATPLGLAGPRSPPAIAEYADDVEIVRSFGPGECTDQEQIIVERDSLDIAAGVGGTRSGQVTGADANAANDAIELRVERCSATHRPAAALNPMSTINAMTDDAVAFDETSRLASPPIVNKVSDSIHDPRILSAQESA